MGAVTSCIAGRFRHRCRTYEEVHKTSQGDGQSDGCCDRNSNAAEVAGNRVIPLPAALTHAVRFTVQDLLGASNSGVVANYSPLGFFPIESRISIQGEFMKSRPETVEISLDSDSEDGESNAGARLLPLEDDDGSEDRGSMIAVKSEPEVSAENKTNEDAEDPAVEESDAEEIPLLVPVVDLAPEGPTVNTQTEPQEELNTESQTELHAEKPQEVGTEHETSFEPIEEPAS